MLYITIFIICCSWYYHIKANPIEFDFKFKPDKKEDGEVESGIDLASHLNGVAGKVNDNQIAERANQIARFALKLKPNIIWEMKKEANKGNFHYKLKLRSNDGKYDTYRLIKEFERMEEFKNFRITRDSHLCGDTVYEAIDFNWYNKERLVDDVFEEIVLKGEK